MPQSFSIFSVIRPVLPALALCLGLTFVLPVAPANAGALRDKIMEKRQERIEQRAGQAQEKNEMSDQETTDLAPLGLPAGTKVLRDLAYGNDKRQTMDIYLPANATSQKAMPAILMVHGGAWRAGSKTARGVVENKAAHWLPKGYIFISINYRMLPDAPVAVQERDVQAALMAAQQRAGTWGGDPSRFILMGHSAGAHLVALLNARAPQALREGAWPWLGTVSLDSAMMNVPARMRAPHLPLYDDAFGTDPAYWVAMSPFHQWTAGAPPMQMVCSTQRADDPCQQSDAMARHVRNQGGRAEVLPQDLDHGEINAQLGLDSDYTRAVEAFMGSLDAEVARRLQ